MNPLMAIASRYFSNLFFVSIVALPIQSIAANSVRISRTIANEVAPLSQVDIIQNYQKVANGIFEAGVKCPHRIWPKFSLSGVDMYLINNSDKTAWHSKLDKTQLSPKLNGIPYIEVPENCKKIRAGGFKFEKTSSFFSRDKIAMCLEVNKTELKNGWPIQANDLLGDLIEHGIHESFHFVYGQDWPRVSQLPKDRNFYYPAKSGPRVFRNELIKSLVEAYTDTLNRDEHLKTAAFWNEQYVNSDAKEFQLNKWVDIIEGSAKYVGTIGWAIAEKGCEISENDLHDFLRRKIVIPEVTKKPIASIESYSIGLVANLLLSEMNVPGFQKDIELGSTPIDVLLKGIKSIPAATDPVRRMKVEQGIATTNAEFGLVIDSFLSNMKSDEFFPISISWDDRIGSYNPSAFIKVESYPKAIIIPTYGGLFENLSKGMTIKSEGNAVAWIEQNACGTNQLVFLVPKHDVNIASQGIFIDLPGLKVHAAINNRKLDPFFKQALLCL